MEKVTQLDIEQAVSQASRGVFETMLNLPLEIDPSIMRNQIEHILFEVRASAADSVNLVLTDHLGERESKLSRTHRATDRDEHLAAVGKQFVVSIRGIDERRSVEMTIVVLDKRCNRRHVLFLLQSLR